MSGKGLLACRKGDRLWWRSQPGHDRPGYDGGRRLGNPAACGSSAAKETLFLGNERRHGSAHRSSPKIIGLQPERGSPRRLAAHKGVVRHNSHRARDIAICIVEVLHIDVVHSCLVRAVRGDIRLMRTKRKPSNAVARGLVGTPSGASNECYERGRVNQAAHVSPRHPHPCIAAIRPPAVMERGKPPRGIVDPGPAPGINPGPMPESIRRPPHNRHRRRPDGPQGRVDCPASILVKVFDPIEIPGHVLG